MNFVQGLFNNVQWVNAILALFNVIWCDFLIFPMEDYENPPFGLSVVFLLDPWYNEDLMRV